MNLRYVIRDGEVLFECSNDYHWKWTEPTVNEETGEEIKG